MRRQDIVHDPLEEGAYDLIHARYLLMPLPQRQRVIQQMHAALRPGGWLVVEEGDFRTYQLSDPPSEALAATGAAVTRLLELGGADPSYGLKVFPALAAAGLGRLHAEAHQGIAPAGARERGICILILRQLRGRLVATGLASDHAIDQAIAELSTPSSTAIYGSILVSVRAQHADG